MISPGPGFLVHKECVEYSSESGLYSTKSLCTHITPSKIKVYKLYFLFHGY